MQVKDKVVVVTGGASGIGYELATRFKAEGAAHVAVADMNPHVMAVGEEIGGIAEVVDVSDVAALTAFIDRIEAEAGPIDLFCSNAGIGTGMGIDADDDMWAAIWGVNVMAHVYAARILIPRMKERGGGYLLNTASAAGLLTNLGDAAYSVTKAGAVGLAEWLSITHAADGIKVSCLCPMAVRTPMTDSDDPAVANVVSHGMIEPEVLADAVIAGLETEELLILPHPEVAHFMQTKASAHEKWLHGMRKLQTSFFE